MTYELSFSEDFDITVSHPCWSNTEYVKVSPVVAFSSLSLTCCTVQAKLKTSSSSHPGNSTLLSCESYSSKKSAGSASGRYIPSQMRLFFLPAFVLAPPLHEFSVPHCRFLPWQSLFSCCWSLPFDVQKCWQGSNFVAVGASSILYMNAFTNRVENACKDHRCWSKETVMLLLYLCWSGRLPWFFWNLIFSSWFDFPYFPFWLVVFLKGKCFSNWTSMMQSPGFLYA